MAALHAGMLRGVMAWTTKLHFLGRVAGLAESSEAAVAAAAEGDSDGDGLPSSSGSSSSSVPLQCARMLSDALRLHHTDRALTDV